MQHFVAIASQTGFDPEGCALASQIKRLHEHPYREPLTEQNPAPIDKKTLLGQATVCANKRTAWHTIPIEKHKVVAA